MGHSTLAILHLKIPIHAKWMLELHIKIVEQLISLKSESESTGRTSSSSWRSTTRGQIRAIPKAHLALRLHSSGITCSSEDALSWDYIPLNVHVGGAACRGKVRHIM
jgi:hypothetical protein